MNASAVYFHMPVRDPAHLPGYRPTRQLKSSDGYVLTIRDGWVEARQGTQVLRYPIGTVESIEPERAVPVSDCTPMTTNAGTAKSVQKTSAVASRSKKRARSTKRQSTVSSSS